MYHLPKGRTWDAELLTAALQQRGVKATCSGDRIVLTLAVERIDIDRIVNATAFEDLKAEIVGFTSATIFFDPNAGLENIVFEYEHGFKGACCPRTSDVTDAILDCGYDAGSFCELANKHYTGEIDINAIFAKIAELQIEKEQAIVESQFGEAKTILDTQQLLKQQIEALIQDSLRDC